MRELAEAVKKAIKHNCFVMHDGWEIGSIQYNNLAEVRKAEKILAQTGFEPIGSRGSNYAFKRNAPETPEHEYKNLQELYNALKPREPK